MFGAQKSSRMKGFHAVAFTADFQVLANIDEGRHIRVNRPKRAREHGAHVRRCHGLRRRISSVPVILMPGMQYVA